MIRMMIIIFTFFILSGCGISNQENINHSVEKTEETIIETETLTKEERSNDPNLALRDFFNERSILLQTIDPHFKYRVEDTIDDTINIVAESAPMRPLPYNYIDYSFTDGEVEYSVANDGSRVILFSQGKESVLGDNPSHQTPATIENGKLYVLRLQDDKQEIVSYTPGDTEVSVETTLPEEALSAYALDVDGEQAIVATWNENDAHAQRTYWLYTFSTDKWEKCLDANEGIVDIQLIDYVLVGIHANLPNEGPDAQTIRVLNLKTLEWIDTGKFAQAKEGAVLDKDGETLYISYGARIIEVNLNEKESKFVSADITNNVKATIPAKDGFVILTKENTFYYLTNE